MYFSDNTLKVLKNFAAINQGIILQPGHELKTMSPKRDLFVEAIIQEEIPFSFAIYDLNEFLAALTLVGDHFLEFDKEFLTIIGDNEEFKFYYSNPSVIISPGDKKITMGEIKHDFVISKSCLDQIKELSKEKDTEDFVINETTLNKNGIEIRGYKKTDSYSRESPHYLEIDCKGQKYTIPTERISKLMSLDYRVEICNKEIARLTALDTNLVYYLGLQLTE